MDISYILNFWNGVVVVIGGGVLLWFNQRYKVTKSRPLLNSLPGIFTSLGLLGTFCAIVQSLGGLDASYEIIDNTGQTVAQVQASANKSLDIIKIISDLIPAFTSSILGLICAFFVTVWTKYIYANEDKKLDDQVKGKSPEELFFNMSNTLSTISDQLTEQDQRSKAYSDRLNTTIGQQSSILEKFITDFVSRMDGIFTRMNGAIEQQVKDFGEEQFRKSSVVLQEMTNKLSTISTGIMEEQKNTVQTMISDINEELCAVSANVTTQMSKLCDVTTTALQDMGTKQTNEFNAIITNYNELSTKLSNQNSEFAEKVTTQMNAEYEKVQQHSIESLQQMVTLKEAYQGVNAEMLQSTTSMNKEISDELRNSLTSLVADLHHTVNQECTALSEAITANVQTLHKSYDFISDHVANIKGCYDQSAIAFHDAVNNANRMNESSEKMLITIDKSLESVVRTNEKVDQAITIIEERQENIENLIVHINEISTTIELLQKLESALHKIAN